MNDNVYTKHGFKFVGISKPSYYYFKPSDTNIKYHRFTLRKRKDEPDDISEFELRSKEGWYWIYDAGCIKYETLIEI